MTNKIENKITTISPIAWAKKHDKAAQLVYGWLRQGKLPAECIYEEANTGKRYLIEEEMDIWYNEHQANLAARSAGGSSVAKKDPQAILKMVISWFGEAGHDKIAEDLQKVYDKKVAEEVPVEAVPAPSEEAVAPVAEEVPEAPEASAKEEKASKKTK